MKKPLLSSIIAVALLAGCDDKPDEQAINKAADTATKIVAVDISRADLAEQTFNKGAAASQTYYQTYLASHPMVDTLTYEVISYDKGQDAATAVTKASVNLTMEIEGKKSYELDFKHSIKYDAATVAAGLIAKVDSVIVKPEGLNEEQTQFFDELGKHLVMTTDIKKDESFAQHTALESFSFDDEEATITFNGLSLDSQGTLKNLAGGFGQSTLDFKGLKTNDGFSIEPFGFTGEYKPDGVFDAHSTTPLVIKMSESENDGLIRLEKVTAKGNLKMDEKYNMMLGKVNYTITNIQVTGGDMPFPVTVDSITVDADNVIDDKELLSQKMDVKIVPVEGLVAMASQGMLDASQADIHFSLNKLPASVMLVYQTMMNEAFNDADSEDNTMNTEAMEPQLKTMFESVKRAGSEFDLNLTLTTTDGNVKLDSRTLAKSDSTVTFDAIKNSDSPETFLKLLDLTVNASIPATLLERTGMQMMAGPFLQKNGDIYESKVTNENGQLLINGMPAPL